VVRPSKTYAGVTLALTQIDAADRVYEQLKDWNRPLEALELLNTRLPGFDTPITLLKSTAINGLMATQILALVAMAAHVQDVLANAQLETAGPELVDKVGEFKHKGKQRNNVSFASKFAHFFIDADRFPMKDGYSTKMVEFHVGTANCVQTKKNVLDESYEAYVQNIEQLKKRDGLGRISHRRLDRYLWFAGKYRFFLKKSPFETGAPKETTKKEFLDSLKACSDVDLATVLDD